MKMPTAQILKDLIIALVTTVMKAMASIAQVILVVFKVIP